MIRNPAFLNRRFCGLVCVVIATMIVWNGPASIGEEPAASTAPVREPLSAEIDRLLAADSLVPKMPPADDAEFLRRAQLDLWGIIPTAAEARLFFEDQAADKRTRLIDRLLSSPRFARHMATTFDVMWIERQNDKIISFNAWYDFLYQSFLANKPYDQLVREILAADEANRPATRFYHARTCAPDALTRDIGRLFFGMDLQCNQCHDHPVVEDYKITDYYGLRAFVARTYVFNNTKKKVMEVAEKPDGETSFTNVFTNETAAKIAPRLPRGAALPAEPAFAKGEELVAKPAKGERPVPKFSRRALLAEQATSANYDLLDRNAVNRLWAQLFGRGLVHPVDFIHPDNPPSHPAVLELLSRDFRAHGCDIKRTLRELMLTEAYSRTCELPALEQLDPARVSQRLADVERDLAALRAQLAEAEAAAMAPREDFAKLQAAAKKDAKSVPDEQLAAAAAARDAAIDAIRPIKSLTNATAKSLTEAQMAHECFQLAKSNAPRAAQQWSALCEFWNERGDLPRLRPLSPEAFADSILQAAGIVATAEAKARSKIKSSPPKELKDLPADQQTEREAILVDQQTFEPLRTNFSQFVALYAETPGQDFSSTVNQALFFGNGGLVEGWLKPSGENLTARLDALTDVNQLADELYLSVLTRWPSDDERQNVTAFLKDRTNDRAAAIQEMTWGLLSSSEFRFNH